MTKKLEKIDKNSPAGKMFSREDLEKLNRSVDEHNRAAESFDRSMFWFGVRLWIRRNWFTILLVIIGLVLMMTASVQAAEYTLTVECQRYAAVNGFSFYERNSGNDTCTVWNMPEYNDPIRNNLFDRRNG